MENLPARHRHAGTARSTDNCYGCLWNWVTIWYRFSNIVFKQLVLFWALEVSVIVSKCYFDLLSWRTNVLLLTASAGLVTLSDCCQGKWPVSCDLFSFRTSSLARLGLRLPVVLYPRKLLEEYSTFHWRLVFKRGWVFSKRHTACKTYQTNQNSLC